MLVPLGDKKDAVSVREAFAKAFYSLPTELKKTLTYDQGKEMSEHQRFTIDDRHRGILRTSIVSLGKRNKRKY